MKSFTVQQQRVRITDRYLHKSVTLNQLYTYDVVVRRRHVVVTTSSYDVVTTTSYDDVVVTTSYDDEVTTTYGSY